VPEDTSVIDHAAVSGVPEPPPPVAAAPVPSEPSSDYSARGRVKQVKQPGMRRLELSELRDMPGAFGDPFRAVEVLPGIAIASSPDSSTTPCTTISASR
jgi:hypothetical protein